MPKGDLVLRKVTFHGRSFTAKEVVAETVRAYVEAGVAGINLEDQVLGQPGPKRIVARELMIEKLASARRAARDAGKR